MYANNNCGVVLVLKYKQILPLQSKNINYESCPFQNLTPSWLKQDPDIIQKRAPKFILPFNYFVTIYNDRTFPINLYLF